MRGFPEALPDRAEAAARRATDRYILVMLTLFPLFTWIDGYLYLNREKFFFFAGAAVLWLPALVPALLRRPFRLPDGTDFGLLLLTGAWLLSCAVNRSSLLDLASGRCNGPATYLLYGCVLLGVRRFGSPRRAYVYALAASYFLCCCIAALQLLGYNPLGLYPGELNYYAPYVQEHDARFLGTVGNIDVMSAFHCLCCPLLGAYVLLGREKGRFVLLIPLLLGLICAAAAGVASGLTALLFTAAVFLPPLLLRRRYPGLSSGAFAGAVLGAWALLAVLALGIVMLVPAESGTLWELRQVLRGDIRDSFGSNRVALWRDAWRIFCSHPLLGIGTGRFQDYTMIISRRWSEALGTELVTLPDNPHNEYLQLLVSFGLAGAFPALWLLAGLWRHLLSALPRRPAAVLAPCILCYLVQAFFNIGLCIITPMFCILLAFGLGMGRDSRPGTETRRTGEKDNSSDTLRASEQ